MYLYKITTKDSSIDGIGVFASEPIPKGSIVWKYDDDHDKSMTNDEFLKLDKEAQLELEKVGYISAMSGLWIYPPKDDPARYTNHHPEQNNLSAEIDQTISPEPFFRANRDIEVGEELTNNYLEFDGFVSKENPDWI
jgi:uncharacterized protein